MKRNKKKRNGTARPTTRPEPRNDATHSVPEPAVVDMTGLPLDDSEHALLRTSYDARSRAMENLGAAVLPLLRNPGIIQIAEDARRAAEQYNLAWSSSAMRRGIPRHELNLWALDFEQRRFFRPDRLNAPPKKNGA